MAGTHRVREIGPGLLLCVALAVLARGLGSASGLGLETALALGLGLLVGSHPAVRALAVAGGTWAARVLLRLGVALLGARLSLEAVVAGGAAAVLGAAVVVVVGLALGWWLARRLELGTRVGALIAVGMAICGNSAILGLAPLVRADSRETAYAVSTITLFGLAGVLLLPAVGSLAGLPEGVIGTWAGLSINDTAQVVAAGYAVSPAAGDVATIVKLTRNLAIAPVLIGAALLVGQGAAEGSARRAVVRAVPWFVVGFIALAGLRTIGALDVALPGGLTLAELLSTASAWLILVALAGVGLAADLRALIGLGPRPLTMGIALWVVIVVLGLAAAMVLGDAVYDGAI